MEYKHINSLVTKYFEYEMPLYLSYPVESTWNGNANTKKVTQTFNKVQNPALYIHLPFCRNMCDFCCCNSIEAKESRTIDTYIKYLSKEIEFKGKLLGNKKITRIHLGGGTPTYMSNSQIDTLLDKLEEVFCLSDECIKSLEGYPDKSIISRQKLEILKNRGFTYISYGIQDISSRVLNMINRRYDYNEASDIFRISKELGFEVGVDVCYGLPLQGIKDIENTIEETISQFTPDKIVAYPYTHFPNIFPRQKKIPTLSLPNNFLKTIMAYSIDKQLANDYKKVGTDTYLSMRNKSGKMYESSYIRDFMGTVDSSKQDVIGIGVGAISNIQNTYFENYDKLNDYYRFIETGMIADNIKKMHVLTDDDLLRRDIILCHILGNHRINMNEIELKYSIDFTSYFSNEMIILSKFEEEGLIEENSSGIITFTETGQYFSRCVAHVFDIYYRN